MKCNILEHYYTLTSALSFKAETLVIQQIIELSTDGCLCFPPSFGVRHFVLLTNISPSLECSPPKSSPPPSSVDALSSHPANT
mmetsp:Transcript_38823/g.93399  ORF Transcript_38823/g.93399 Transcript_38823/m.93399 type:complete len:83 (+) Transcript_38823:109-357(+)